jgi:hypothetical protein
MLSHADDGGIMHINNHPTIVTTDEHGQRRHQQQQQQRRNASVKNPTVADLTKGLIHFIASRKCQPFWQYEDITRTGKGFTKSA